MAASSSIQLSYGGEIESSPGRPATALFKFELGIVDGSIAYLTHRVPDEVFTGGTIEETYLFSGGLQSRRPHLKRARANGRVDKPTFMLDLVVVANEISSDVDDLVALGILSSDQSVAVRLAIGEVTSGRFGPVFDGTGKIASSVEQGFAVAVDGLSQQH